MFSILRDKRNSIPIFIFFIFLIWWFLLRFTDKFSLQNQIFGSVYGVLALYGALQGIRLSSRWGGVRSIMGKAILLLSLGLFAQVFGQVVYSIYTFFLHIEIPYPSLGDLGYFGSIPFYIYGVYNVARASGVRFTLHNLRNRLITIIIPLIILIFGYYMFLQGYVFDWNQPLRIFLDFGYPLGEAIYVSLALSTLLLTKNILGGVMKSKIIYILSALCMQFISDYAFLYQSLKQAAYPAGINDLFYLISYFLMTMALLQFESYRNKTINPNEK